LIEAADRSERCLVHSPVGLPVVPPGLEMPQDAAALYELCGGVDLYADADYGVSIVPPAEFLPANLVVLGEQFDDDPSSAWFVIARTVDREYLSIDL
jgi:hypothetical protein